MDPTTILERAREALDAKHVIGAPYEKNGVTVLPMVSIRGGGGGGAGETPEGKGSGSGSGVALAAHPVGAYVIRGDRVTWVPSVDANRLILGAQIVAVVAMLMARSIVRARARRALGQTA
jgi:uncharacterized spore protein YtfJ